jgi:hypothetical protein
MNLIFYKSSLCRVFIKSTLIKTRYDNFLILVEDLKVTSSNP